jgi:hypothetical protein
MKKFIWMGSLIGSTLGGMIPSMWGAGMFSVSGLVLSGVGAIAGIWVGYKAGKMVT